MSDHHGTDGIFAVFSLLKQHLLVAGSHFFGFLEHLLGVGEHVARLGLQCLGGQGDSTTLCIEINDHDFHLIVDVEHRVRRFNVLVADLGNVKQTTDTADVDEGAVGLDATDGADHDFANLEAIHLPLNQSATMAEHKTVALFVDFQELQRQEVSNQLFLGLACTDV